MKTTRDLKINFRDFHDVEVPAGTPVEKAHGTGPYVVHPSRVHLKSQTRAISDHDATYYFIFIPEDAIGE
jgi:hypothetical protein